MLPERKLGLEQHIWPEHISRPEPERKLWQPDMRLVLCVRQR